MNDRINLNRTPSRRRPARSIRRAFTLLEVIVVVTIIALLAAMVAPRLLGNIGRAKTRIAQTGVSSIAQQLGIYLADNGMSKPPPDFDLSVLTQGDDPLLREKDLIDPWGNPYILRVPGIVNPGFDIVSLGADGEPGGEGEDADIVN